MVTAKIITCKRCGSASTGRIRRNLLDRAFSVFIPTKRYFCDRCLKSFVLFGVANA